MENKPVQRRQLPVVLQVILLSLWLLICGIMWLSAILGLLCVVEGTISLFVDGEFLGMSLGGETVRTTTQKALFTAFGAALVIGGIAFWWLSKRGYVAPLVVYALLWALLSAIGWWTGSSEIISLYSSG